MNLLSVRRLLIASAGACQIIWERKRNVPKCFMKLLSARRLLIANSGAWQFNLRAHIIDFYSSFFLHSWRNQTRSTFFKLSFPTYCLFSFISTIIDRFLFLVVSCLSVPDEELFSKRQPLVLFCLSLLSGNYIFFYLLS